MKRSISVLCAAALCCLGCVEVDLNLGGNLVPVDQTYNVYVESRDLPEVNMLIADSLSGYSTTRITIGAIRDEKFGLSTRASAFSIVPLNDTLDFGENPVVRRMHFSSALDTLSTTDKSFDHNMQNVKVYELLYPLDASKTCDGNATIAHSEKPITIGTPVINGTDSLSFDFSLDYARKFLEITQEDLDSAALYFKKIPGIYMETSNPHGNGGRINMYKLQLGYDNSSYYLTGNYARLDLTSTYKGERKDTSFYFYYGALDIISSDSLLTNYSSGSFPEYALNLTGHESSKLEGKAGETVLVEGGGGLKPVISARMLVDLAREMILEKTDDYRGVVINRATIELPFRFPDNYQDMEKYPYILSPTCRLMTDTTATFMSLTDSSNENENQGNIDRSNLKFAPDITYHLQELVKIKDDDKTKQERLDNGSYDIWFLIKANEVVTTSSSSSSNNEMSEYYQYLAYQSYYNNMYGYGYGSYGNSYYNNYYTYMMMAAYAGSGSSSSVETSQVLDRDRYYSGWLNGPLDPDRKPRLILTFSVPNKAE